MDNIRDRHAVDSAFVEQALGSIENTAALAVAMRAVGAPFCRSALIFSELRFHVERCSKFEWLIRITIHRSTILCQCSTTRPGITCSSGSGGT